MNDELLNLKEHQSSGHQIVRCRCFDSSIMIPALINEEIMLTCPACGFHLEKIPAIVSYRIAYSNHLEY